MGYNLDFSGWKAGNKALAASKVDSTNAYAKAQATKDAGISAGIGTVIGAIFGGPGGAALGYNIGKSVSSNPEAEANMTSGKDAVAGFADAFDSWSEDRSATKKKKAGTPFGGGNDGDMMQMASAMNMIDDNGNIKPSFLEYIQGIGA